MDAITAYTYCSATWLGIQAVPLLLTPKLITTLLSQEAKGPTDLEIYFCRSLALTLITLALVTLVLTGSIPLTSSISDPEPDSPSALAVPTLTLTTSFHASSAFYGYMKYTTTSQTAFAFSVTGSGFLAAMGVWCLLFGGGQGSSKDNVSGWPFTNVAADRMRKERRLKNSGIHLSKRS